MKKTFIFLLTVLLCSSCSMKNDTFYEGGYTNGAFIETSIPSTGDRFEEFSDNPFIETTTNPVSTFSIDADGASYAYARMCIKRGGLPNPNAVRIEEFINYFHFNYPAPQEGDALAINAEVGNCPWNDEHKLIRLGIKGKTIAKEALPNANYVFLIDVSGSMDTKNKLGLIKEGMIMLVGELNPNDRISIITYSGTVERILESTKVEQSDQIVSAIRRLEASGSTAGGAALKMAYEEALEHYIEDGNNRIILGTDGDFNVGVSSTDELLEIVSEQADHGIYLTACGVGTGNWNDQMMEKISNRGNGTYYYIDSADELVKIFVHDRSYLQAVANDTKCQIRFDSTMVKKYRLIGYENRVMSNEDFEDDKKDAGEIGAGQSITALYEIEPTEQWQTDATCATFECRYKTKLNTNSCNLSLPINQWVGQQSEDLNFCAGVASYGMLLRGSEYMGTSSCEMAINLIQNASTYDPYGYRAELVELIQTAEELLKKE